MSQQLSACSSIPTYIVNLKSRPDRKAHALKEFDNQQGFTIHFVEACVHECGAIGLWNTIKTILSNIADDGPDYILICEDDHQFTAAHSYDKLMRCIQQAKEFDADILLGGVSGFSSTVQVTNELFWVEMFSGLQFTVIYRKFFQVILNTSFAMTDVADFKISLLSANKFLIYPFVSIQKEFGYSDVTLKNNVKGFVEELFLNSAQHVGVLKRVFDHYKSLSCSVDVCLDGILESEITLPVYVITASCSTAVERQFDGKSEFEVVSVDQHSEQPGSMELWLIIKKIIGKALGADEDLIIICNDNHVFSDHYSFDYLLTNILTAHQMGADYLSCGKGRFDKAVPVTESLYWINQCLSAQFLVVYKKFYQRILDEPIQDGVPVSVILSDLTSNKLLLYPFISASNDADSTKAHEVIPVKNNFITHDPAMRLSRIRDFYCFYNNIV